MNQVFKKEIRCEADTKTDTKRVKIGMVWLKRICLITQ
jgi:hypothetical protein